MSGKLPSSRQGLLTRFFHLVIESHTGIAVPSNKSGQFSARMQ